MINRFQRSQVLNHRFHGKAGRLTAEATSLRIGSVRTWRGIAPQVSTCDRSGATYSAGESDIEGVKLSKKPQNQHAGFIPWYVLGDNRTEAFNSHREENRCRRGLKWSSSRSSARDENLTKVDG
jgi:hypothetical protein